MGLAISLQIIQPSQLYLSKTLWLLAAFGFTHAISEWGYFFVPLQTAGSKEHLLLFAQIHLITMALSFAFLLSFGLAQYYHSPKTYLMIPFTILLIWYINYVLYFDRNLIPIWYAKCEIWARYLLGFPGAVMAGLGLWIQAKELKSWGSQIQHFLKLASLTLLFYSVLAGLIVPKGDFFPSNVLNNDHFYTIFHIPVQVARALLSILLSWYVLKLLSVFRMEYQDAFDRIQQLETLAKERQRIANDIHDGAIQAIYGSGMLLDRAEELIDKNPERSKEIISNVIHQLNDTIDSLRRYIHGLKSEDFGRSAVDERLHQIIKQSQDAFSDRKITSSINLPNWFILIPEGVEHINFILQEAIANAARHSSCTTIDVIISGTEKMLEMRISDNGTGIPASLLEQTKAPGMNGHGLESIKQRAKQLNAKFDLLSDSNGTSLTIIIGRK